MRTSREQAIATNALRVLIVEDSDDDLLLLLHELDRGGYAVSYTRVETTDGLRSALEEDWQLVLSDFSLPTMTAHDVLRVVRAERPDLPCIVISGTITEEAAVDVLRGGARDFVVKERMARLLPAIERAVSEAAERQRLRATEATLRETRARMQFALESVGIGFWDWNVRSGRTIWSDVLERLHGLQPGTFGGTHEAFIDAVHPDDRQQVLRSLEQARRDSADSRIEYRTLWPDGSMHWMIGIGRMFFDDEGKVVRAAGVGMDITTQKQLEDQFRQAQKMESIGNLAGGIAHDFNNLLTVIVGCCELAEARVQSDPDAAESLEGIRTAAVSATALARQLLTFSRRQIVTPRLLDLNDSITGFERILRRLVEANITIDVRLAPWLRTVRVDPGQVEQVLLNLVANARDAMPDGGTVTIETRTATVNAHASRTHSDVAPGEYVLLAVSDTGCGMSPEVRARLFEPFFTTKPPGQGTGLGLATVYGIVKQSGGHILVRSTPGRGTTFEVYLPSEASSRDGGPEEGKRSATSLAGTETILVVEDNASLRRLNERILQRYGYTVLVAGEGEEALRICADHQGPIHLVLVDVVMPGDSGPVVGEWICERRPGTKIVYMSGYTGEAVNRHSMLRPGTVFLQKPFDATQLARTVRDVLSCPAT
jgi:two-component system cell cycle sensor histidine kinase/response regulator CckA